MPDMDYAASIFATAARTFAELVSQISDWDAPGLGEWDLRALVGHTSRSLITVSSYLQTTASHEDITSAAGYYVAIRGVAAGLGAGDIIERGRQAGRDLGADPATTVDALVDRALTDIAGVDDPLITVIGGLGIRLHTYLPTRTFELAVHGLDIARATGIELQLPVEVLQAATTLAAHTAVALGDGVSVLDALTGRAALPPGFSVV